MKPTSSSVPASPRPSTIDDDRTPTGIRAHVEPLRAGAERALAATRGRVVLVDVALRGVERFGEMHGSILAGYLAYRLFLLLLPLVVIVVALAGVSTDTTRATAEHLSLGETVMSTVVTASEDTGRSRIPLLLTGVVGFTVAAWGFLGALQVTSAQAWRIPTRRFPGKSRTFLRLAGSLLLFGLVFYVAALVRKAGLVAGLAGTTATLLSEFVAYFGLGWILPRRSREWYWLLPGAVAGAVGHLALQVIATWYVPDRLAGASRTYGALGLTVTILAYLFLIGLLLTMAPIINAVVWDHFRGSPPGLLRRVARLVPIPTDIPGSGYVPEGGAVDATIHVPGPRLDDGTPS